MSTVILNIFPKIMVAFCLAMLHNNYVMNNTTRAARPQASASYFNVFTIKHGVPAVHARSCGRGEAYDKATAARHAYPGYPFFVLPTNTPKEVLEAVISDLGFTGAHGVKS